MTNTTSRRKIAGLSAETYSEPCQKSKMKLFVKKVKGNESRYISLFAVTESIKKLFSIDHVNIYLFSMFFSTGFARWKRLYQQLSFLNIFFNRFSSVEKYGVTPLCLFRDSVVNYFRKKTHLRYLAGFQTLFWSGRSKIPN